MRLVSIALVFVIANVNVSRCARILCVWPIAGGSHYILGNTLAKGLANAGHDVTLISPFEDKVPPSRGTYRNVVLTGVLGRMEEHMKKMDMFQFSMINNPFTPIFMQKFFGESVDQALSHPNVQKLLQSGEKFDAVIIEHFSNDALRALAHHFDAHLILFSSIFASSWVNGMAGNPTPLAYVPDIATSFAPEMSLLERIQNTLIYSIRQLLFHYYVNPAQETIRKKYFADSPSIYESYYNASIILLNGHESLNQPVPLVPNMVPIGGYHIQPPKRLSEDLQKILDAAKEGVVYVSMGSNLKSRDMPKEKRDIILKSLGRLKEKVLWKWEDENLPGKPDNVETRKWFPQSDILAHPNVKLFVTHGGLLSTTETVYHGKPILSLPVFGDQVSNAILAELGGYALRLNFHDPDWSEERFYALLRELLDNPEYRDNVQKRSKLFHDRPMKPMDTMVYWVEYVLRNDGAKHLRVLGTALPWYQYFLLDVISVLLVTGCSILFAAVKIVRYILRRTRTKVKKQ